MLLQVARELFDVLVGELEVVESDELRPAEAERAVRVARLARGGEEEDRLVILVLDARNGFAVHGRDVVRGLARGVRVEFVLDLADRLVERRLVVGLHE